MNTRKDRYAGAWYTDNAEALRKEIDGYLQQAENRHEKSRDTVCGAVLPHAGLYFSGRGIAQFFSALDPHTEEIIIIAPSHYAYIPPDTLTYAAFDAYETPLGEIPGVPKKYEQLQENYRSEQNRALEMEHAVEMFLPFIARENEKRRENENGGKPVHAGTLLISQLSNESFLRRIQQILTDWMGEENLRSRRTAVIASSDFTHYGTRFQYTPYGISSLHGIEDKVEQYDRMTAQRLIDGVYAELFDELERSRPTICGIAPAMIVSAIMRNQNRAGSIADYSNSNQFVSPDVSFVSYCTILWK